MEIPMRPLGLVREVVTEMGLEITYAYEDLVFVQHNAFLFQFTGSGPFVNVYFNVDCVEADRERLLGEISAAASCRDLIVTAKGQYELVQNEDETMSINFS